MKFAAPVLLVGLGLLSLALALWQAPRLPSLVASHFNATGHADGWMPATRFVQIQVLMALAIPALFGLLSWMASALPRVATRMPRRDRDFADTRDTDIGRRIARLVLVTGCGVLAFLVFLQQRVFQANVDHTFHLTPSPDAIRAIALLLIVGPTVLPLLSFWRRTRTPGPRRRLG